MTLKGFHLIFLLITIMGADLFGGWAIHEYNTTHEAFTLALGIVSMAGGLGLAAYVLWFVRKAETAHLQ